MVSTHMENLVSNIKLSSVVPAKVTGEDTVHHLTNLDLAMKLHYLKGVYFFKSEAVQGLHISDLKHPMFQWLNFHSAASGRIRRSENGRPFIKCNDGGVRIVEARCSKTLDEWDQSLNLHLTYNHVLGPDLGFSPLVFLQFTWFKCGGLSVGISWAHILGDAFSASTFINMWGQIIAGHLPPHPLNMPNTGKYQFLPPNAQKPFSLKKMDPVGDHWLTTNNCKMETHSLHVTSKQLNNLLSKICTLSQTANFQPFAALSAIIWKSLAKIRGKLEPKIVTICTNNSLEREDEISSNNQVISTVEANFHVANADLLELAKLIVKKTVDERSMIEELVEREDGALDFIVYGANLTFVNLEEAKIYGLELKGHKAIFANYTIDGVGDEGVVLVLPGPRNGKKEGIDGRTVTMVLPEYQVVELKNELKEEWNIF